MVTLLPFVAFLIGIVKFIYCYPRANETSRSPGAECVKRTVYYLCYNKNVSD